ncbi:hypothetical protein [Marispirochaeta sp.]|uniref:hypothetical protein n=1 Tax=Marispirochaeta sp. TaxID=2038653 RepID=UPI0029C86543|nr:hypothetical protein [Marispirochaeta sp.]
MKGLRFPSSVLIILLLFCSLALYPQAGTIFSPFPSSLRATETGEGIRLTWRDSPDILGTYHIFRHSTEIGEENFNDAEEIGTVPPGISTFIDYPDDTRNYYYAVLIEDSAGGLFELFIPFRNITVYPVSAQPITSEKELSANITGLTAEVRGDGVQLRFEADRKDRILSIYRHTDPIADVDDLLRASSIDMIESDQSVYTDYPIPGIPYYYGVFDTKLIQTGTFVFNPGRNISVQPVKIGREAERTGLAAPNTSLRSPPLPKLMLQRSVISGDQLAPSLNLISPGSRPMAETTRAAVDELLAGLPRRQEKPAEAEILPAHIHGDFSGAAYTLSLILRERFLTGDYEETASSLKEFLSIKREETIERAARFYLGQACFFNGEYREALFQFLSAQQDYYAESQVWIDRIYPRLSTSP